MSVNYDVIIIGSGPAGMAAAQTLRRRGIHNIAILEREAHAGAFLVIASIRHLACSRLSAQ